MFKLGLLGYPLSHSLSPEIYSFLAKKQGVPVSYDKFSVPPEELLSFIPCLKGERLLQGWNVTIPYKESIVPLLDELSPDAQKMGAVNLVKKQDGKWCGYNTDLDGIRFTLQNHGVQVRDRSAVILGAGGAALAAGFVLAEQGASEILILNRNPDRAQTIVNRLGPYFQSTQFMTGILGQEIVNPYSIYVQCTPVGMKGYADALRSPMADFPRPSENASRALKTFAFDLVYRPSKTPFLIEAERQGLEPIGGLEMLVEQAMSNWEIWTGQILSRMDLRPGLMQLLHSFLEKD